MGGSKNILDKEIVIVKGKPMWKSDYKKLVEKERNAKFIAFYTLTSNYSKDVTLTIVKVTENTTNDMFSINDCSQYDEVSLLRKTHFSLYEYNRSSYDCTNSYAIHNAIHLDECDEFWTDLDEKMLKNM